ncbi:LysR family transcriptional regulator [Novosphingobium sp. Fuku2-ISO-50]|uniref:LysR family transcriptional regulator n=1 Tax=Novosphingobium sp. Fuku2-ISO-50 TaxID=1739114 RepID=UPI00076D8B3C|nr:LysR family transcriptional regulator [Novosphingobium sp. Fuku2-ISO-50]KUR77485.1 hypothetical protein AQZ50_09790 [Novosphingobium sp. Fuku2-ISO-50]
MSFDERHLRAFLAIADTGSLGRAAHVVNLTQPSLSRVLQAMERQLGHRLFDRESKGMVLTHAGEVLLLHARLLAFEMQAARDELDALVGLRRGAVRIGAVAAVMRALVAPSAGRMLEDNPQLRLELLEAVDGDLLDGLLRRQIDLAITAGALDSAEVELIGLCDYADRFSVFCAKGHPRLGEGMVDATMLMAEGWVMPPADATPRRQFSALVQTLGLEPARIVAESASVEAMIALVAHSSLLGWLPEPLLAAHLAQQAVMLVAAPQFVRERRFFLYRRRTGLLPDAARRFLRYLPLVPGGWA